MSKEGQPELVGAVENCIALLVPSDGKARAMVEKIKKSGVLLAKL